VAATNDLMYDRLSTYFGVTDESLGDLMYRLRVEDPTFAGGARKEWYAAKLDGLAVSYDASWHLADLANLFWSQTEPLTSTPSYALLLESGDYLLLESGDHILKEA
jgi:hypothetical protein